MSKEAFVSFETAKLLKEKGFNCKCFDFYETEYEKSVRKHAQRYGPVDWNGEDDENCYSCPTLQMTMRWLREKYLIFFDFRLVLGDTEDGKYIVGVYNMTAFDTYTWKTWVYADTYEETYEKAIKYVLDNNFFIEYDDADEKED